MMKFRIALGNEILDPAKTIIYCYLVTMEGKVFCREADVRGDTFNPVYLRINGVYTPAIAQYSSGLKDQDGVEIYEGDIIELEYSPVEKWEVIFRNGAFVAHKDGRYAPLYHFAMRDNALVNTKVIGNMVESPELLTTGKEQKE